MNKQLGKDKDKSLARKAVLLILDGWGINPNSTESAIAAVKPPFFNQLLTSYPNSALHACGRFVGLPDGVMGNSEVGHENIGAGRVAKQKLTLISEAIQDGSFFKNAVFLKMLEEVRKKKTKVHLIGLLSEGDVHSHLGHLNALIDWIEREQLPLLVHPILDGRDDPPKNCIHLLKDLMNRLKAGKVASVCGRYWAMDRDNNWDRVYKYWKLLIRGEGLKSNNAITAVEEAYNRPDGLYSPKEDSDEFIQPTSFEDVDPCIQDGDAVIFFNFRPDRARQISAALTQHNFNGFERIPFPKINYVCLTSYDHSLHSLEAGANPVLPVAFTDESFPPQDRSMSLGEYLEQKSLKQLRIAETEKFRHVTSFFNQGRENPFDGEDRILIPSPKIATYDLQPEMSIFGIQNKLVEAIKSKKYDLIVANFANADMVGHTGVFEAVKQAIIDIDKALKAVVEACLETDTPILVTADHGNADQMVNSDGSIRTAHSLNQVPCLLISKEHKHRQLNDGSLCDIAPTLLELMGLSKPPQMTGNSLLRD